MNIDRTATDELERRTAALAQQMGVTARTLEFPAFSGECAGRDYVECGNRLAAALGVLRMRMVERAQFVEALGARIGSSSRAIADVDLGLADQLRMHGREYPKSGF
ncbi:hypothetical protein ACFRFQ_16340 [Rhodococcus sp. NPDC056743]|uniref:hypothetical protein n=1 Tax=Rhodococcus sp. NPDC056743 TaxID=3345934 RepID=UPI00366BE315